MTLLEVLTKNYPDIVADYENSPVEEIATRIIELQVKEIKDLTAESVDQEELTALAEGSTITVNVAGDVIFNGSVDSKEPPEPDPDSVTLKVEDFSVLIDEQIGVSTEARPEFWEGHNPHLYRDRLLSTAEKLKNLRDYGPYEITDICVAIALNAMVIADLAGILSNKVHD